MKKLILLLIFVIVVSGCCAQDIKHKTATKDTFGLRSIQDSIFRKKRDSLLLIHKKH